MNKFFLIIAFFLFFISKSRADEGCLVTGTGVFFGNPVASDPTTYFMGNSFYGNALQCPTSPSHTFYVLTATTLTTCYAVYDGSGSTTSPSNYTRTGTKVTFNVAYCPIDDYVWAGILLLGLCGFYLIRNNSLSILNIKSLR